MELYEQIRQEYERGAGTIRAVARKFGVHRRDVRRALDSAMPPDRKRPERKRPRLEPAVPFIDSILEADRLAPRKQRHTAHRMWMRLRQEMPEVDVSESTVRRYVQARRTAMGLMGREVFVPQSYQLGDEAQVDWFEAWVDFEDGRRKVYLFCMRSMALGAAFLGPTRMPRSRRFWKLTNWRSRGSTVCPDGSLPYTVAVHRGKGTNPHAHIVLSERALDGHDRTAETWFKRVASAPRQKGESDEQYQERQSKIDFSKGGARKSIAFQSPDWIGEVRQQWAERANHALDQAKVQERIDHRSHSDRGLQELPTVHVGPRVRAVGKDDRAATNEEIRAANVELAKARTELDLFRKRLAAILREFLAEIREQCKRVRSLQRQLTEQREKSAAEAQKLQAAVDWFVKHGYKNPLESSFYKDKPVLAKREAEQMAGRVGLSEADRAKWIESGRVIADHLAEPRYQDLKTKHPHQTDAWLRNAAMGITVHYKSQERGRSKGHSR